MPAVEPEAQNPREPTHQLKPDKPKQQQQQQWSHIEKEKQNLPDYHQVELIPNKPYNNIEGKIFVETINKTYEETMKWKKNMFQVPTGKCGKDFVKLLSEWMSNFNVGNCFQGIAMKVVMTLPNILLQKPSAKSKSRDHAKILEDRLSKWNKGQITEICEEGIIIQKKLTEKTK